MLIRTLVVDDEKIIRKGIIAALPWTELGMTVVGEASNGAKALEFLEGNAVDLVLTDLSMPVMNGFELIEQLRVRHPRIRTAVFTCHEDFKFIQDVMRMGAMDYIVKTECESDTLDGTMRRIVHRFWELSTSPQTVVPLSEDIFIRAEKMWASLEWAFDERMLEQMLGDLDLLGLTVPEMGRLFANVRETWDSAVPGWLSTGAASSTTLPNSRQEITDMWKSWRKIIRGHAAKALLSPEVSLAVLHSIAHFKDHVAASQEEVAKSVHMSRSYYSQCFKAFLGISFADFAKQMRLGLAERLITETSSSVGDIAERCGFEDHRYFSRLFREKFGFLPAQYRQTVDILQ